MNRNLQKASAWLLTLLLVCQLVLPAAAAESNTIHIQSREDWDALVQSCRLDTWSQNKTVVLDQDLDLSGAQSIPTFGGVFDGGGHTIRGLLLHDEGAHQGLFRYIQEGAVVRDLTVSGRVAPTGSWEAIGGIAGVNRGTLAGCSFQGTVQGGERTGGIAGINEASGQIVRCTVGGIISGSHATGGIAGENYGGILQCTNEARINTQEESASPELDDVTWQDVAATESVLACTDTGGIAGYSKGSIQECVNRGDVGYPHTGYNVGGIAGRQAGYIRGCVNQGQILGRKEVGGIVGQMEPYTLLRYEEDTLQKLANHLDTLNHLLTSALDTADLSRSQISSHITTITGLTDEARASASDLVNSAAGLWDGTADTVNDLSGRVAQVLDDSVDITDDLERGARLLSNALRQLEQALGSTDHMDQDLDTALEELRQAVQAAQNASHLFKNALDPLRDALESGGELGPALVKSLQILNQAKDQMTQALVHLNAALPFFKEAGGALSDALTGSKPAIGNLSDAVGALEDALDGLGRLLRTQSQLPDLELPNVDSDFYDSEARLSDALGSLTDAMEALNQSMDQSGSSFTEDLRRITDQFTAINSLLRSASDGNEDPDVVVDISEESLSAASLGKVDDCRNSAKVEGDINVGGVVGSMAIEFSFDPEDDIAQEGRASTNFQYLTQAVLTHCVSTGPVTARKDCVGGVTGRADLGVILGCENYGPVESTGGEFVGGVAGASYSTIRASWAKCDLTGSRHVGGIAGFASNLSGCGSLVRILDGTAYLGAVAGETDGEVRNNRFVSDLLGGVDGISYAGQAEPVSYETLITMEGIPQAFSTFTLTFTAGGKTVDTRTFSYGQALAEEELPAVPEREGYYGSWENFDASRLTADDTIEAVYVPWVTTLSSADGVILAEGQFSPDTILEVQTLEDEVPQAPPPQNREVYGQWTVSLSDASASFTALRVKLPEDIKQGAVWLLTEEGSWEQLPADSAGSYVRAELEGTSAVLCLTKAPMNPILPVLIAAGLALILLVVLRLRRRRRKKASKS